MWEVAHFHHLACVISHTPSIRPQTGPVQRPRTVGSALCAPSRARSPVCCGAAKKPTEPMRHRSHGIKPDNGRTLRALVLRLARAPRT